MEEKGPYTRTQRFPAFLPRFEWDNFILFPAKAPCPTQGHSRSGYFADEEKGGIFFLGTPARNAHGVLLQNFYLHVLDLHSTLTCDF